MVTLEAATIAGATALACGGVAAALGWLRLGPMVQALGLTACGAAGVAALVGGRNVGAPFGNQLGLAFGLDPLSGFFLGLTPDAIAACILSGLATMPRST